MSESAKLAEVELINHKAASAKKFNLDLKLIVGTFLIFLALIALAWLANSKLSMPIPPAYSKDAGINYASHLAKTAQLLSIVLLIVGWCFVITGAFLAMAAAVVGPVQNETGNDNIFRAILAQRGLLCSAFAIIFVGIGWQCLDRSSAASLAAVAATTAISAASKPTKNKNNNSDRIAYDISIKAKSLWLEGRMNHDRLTAMLGESGAGNQKEKTANDN